MKIKFNKMERVAGLFVLIAFGIGIVSLVAVAMQQSWFESKRQFYTEISSAEGVFPGTKVKIAGLKAGRVDQVELSGDRIVVRFSVLSRYAKRLRQDAYISLSRPFIIGEKVIEINEGSASGEPLPAQALIPTKYSFDLTELLDPKVLQPHFESMARFSENLRYLADAFSEKERSEALVQMFDDLRPLLKNANIASIEVKRVSRQLLKDDNLETVMANIATTTNVLNEEMDNVVQISRELPQLTQNSAEVMKNLATLTTHMNQLIPAITEIAPELPRASRRAIEAMDEAVIVLKAFQKSFLLKSAVADVREEEETRQKNRDVKEQADRQPANTPIPSEDLEFFDQEEP